MLNMQVKENLPKLAVINGKTMKLSYPPNYNTDHITLETDEKSSIKAIVDKTGSTLKVGDSITLQLGDNKIVSEFNICEINTGIDLKHFLLSTHITTKSTYFLLPMLTTNPAAIHFEKEFVNCYIGSDRTGGPDLLLLLYRDMGNKDFDKLCHRLEGFPKFSRRVIGDDNSFHYFCYNLTENQLLNMKKFASGKYSELSEELKKRIIIFHKIKPQHILHKVLYKDEKLKKYLEMNLMDVLPDEIDLFELPDRKLEIVRL